MWTLDEYLPLIPKVKNSFSLPLLLRLTELGWNKQLSNLDEIISACQRAGIIYMELDIPCHGVYSLRGKQRPNTPVIMVNEALRGQFKNYVACHEVSHAFLNPTRQMFCGLESDDIEVKIEECRAHVLASCFLIPTPFIDILTWHEVLTFFGLPLDFYTFRLSVRAQCGF